MKKTRTQLIEELLTYKNIHLEDIKDLPITDLEALQEDLLVYFEKDSTKNYNL